MKDLFENMMDIFPNMMDIFLIMIDILNRIELVLCFLIHYCFYI
jgi:hypothetical protein